MPKAIMNNQMMPAMKASNFVFIPYFYSLRDPMTDLE